MIPPGEHTQGPSPSRYDRDADDDLLKEIRERFEYATNEWREIRNEAAEDMRYVAGDSWEPKERARREERGRPCLALDELAQHFNQVINQVRANKRSVKFSPTGSGATDKTAELYTEHTREIEYRSHAQVAYTTAFQDAIHRSYGFVRLKTEYESDRSFNLQLRIEALVNPDMVLPDPDALRPDSSDMKYCFVLEERAHSEFTREFPKAKHVDFSSMMTEFPQWVKENRILIAEYWTIKTKQRRLLLVQPPAAPAPVPMPGQPPAPPPPPQKPVELYEDEFDLAKLPDGAVVIRERDVPTQSVCQYLTNGLEILETTEWPGKYIPIASCYGMVLYVGGKRQILSMTRLARDPQQLYNYYRTCEAELVGMTPKVPYMAYEGQFSPLQEVEVQKSLHEPVAVLYAKPTLEGLGQQLLPLPLRQPYEPPIQPLEMGAESARRAIQSAMGSSPLPTSAQRRNEKSGVALKQISDSSSMGSFHFNDHYDDMLRMVGVMIEDLLPKVIDTARDIGTRKPNDTAGRQRVNDPTDPSSISTKGDHSVTVSTGPAFESEREAESDFADTLMASPFAPRIADLAVKLKGGGPVLDEIAERLCPPEFKKPKKDGEQPTPQELQQQLQQASGQAQQFQQQLEQAVQFIKTEQIKAQVTIKKAEIDGQAAIAKANVDADTQLALQVMRNAGSIAVAHIGANSRGAAITAHAAEEAQALGLEQQNLAFDAQQQQAGRQHEAAMAQLGHQQALEQGQQGQQHALEQGQLDHAAALQQADQGHQQALEQGAVQADQAMQQQQAAELAPPAAGDAGGLE